MLYKKISHVYIHFSVYSYAIYIAVVVLGRVRNGIQFSRCYSYHVAGRLCVSSGKTGKSGSYVILSGLIGIMQLKSAPFIVC